MRQPNITTTTTPERPMTSGEVAELFAVDAKTVLRWANDGLLKSFKTPGGHRRYYLSDIQATLKGAQS